MQIIQTKMNKKHLFWIIPIVLFIGSVIGASIPILSIVHMEEKYPIIACLYNADTQLRVDVNKLPITKESQIKYLERRCAEIFIDFKTNLSDILQFDDGKYASGAENQG